MMQLMKIDTPKGETRGELTKEIEELERSIAENSASLSRLSLGIAKMEKELEAKFKYKCDEVARLDSEIRAILTDNQLVTGEAQQAKDAYTKFFAGLNQGQKMTENVKIDIATSGQLKALYKKIAQKTHPDRNSHKTPEEQDILNELFLEAREAYEAHDLSSLKEILECASKMQSQLLSKLLLKVSKLRRVERQIKNSLTELKASTKFRMLAEYQVLHYKWKVESYFVALLENRRRELAQILKSLKPETPCYTE